MKIIDSKIHGIIDYLVVVFLLASPILFGLGESSTLLTYSLAVAHLALTAFTRFELGLFKFIPLATHGWIELLVSAVLVVVAFLLGNMEGELARIFFLAVAAGIFVTWALTDSKKPTFPR